MRVGRAILVTVLIGLLVYIAVDDLWRTFVLDTGIAFLVWGLLGTRVRRASTFVGCIVTGFGLGMFDHHPLVGAMVGAIVGVLAWQPLTTRRHRLRERT